MVLNMYASGVHCTHQLEMKAVYILDTLSQADKIEQATNYIVELRERVENLNKRRDQLMTNNSGLITTSIELKDLGSVIEVQIVVQRDCEIKLHEVIRVLEEEGAEVVNATFSTHGNYVLHTLHARAQSSRIGVETSRVQERLQLLI
ncbi:transcription factor bHLH167-like [Chenopodium quinoa]|uniref:transcription factor bHLH167-like n=1 Tax=Chenopodium quinoa TaxID=63459 RepID=UPI000B797367|nr:transcription factor bHLH167-like [Chenopodium quinoa]